MASTSEIRNRLKDRLMAISNSDYLKTLEKRIESSNIQETSIALTEEQKLMLTMSDADIKTGRVIDQECLNKQELEWLQ
ncbi:MAG: hypothetical protein RLO81_02260 [Fulvivirga sp.]|uniref:hypothetical protein n=1 Tax=Fulvivirga sp. TaxID=1931237 RepID=UPI0032EF01DE